MAYKSIDILQNVLAEDVFSHTKDPKKAAGRALGTLVEIITFYMLKAWRLHWHVSVERGLVEYGNPEILHNIEYSLHPVSRSVDVFVETGKGSITSRNLIKKMQEINFVVNEIEPKQTTLLTKSDVLRNSCTIAESKHSFFVSYLEKKSKNKYEIKIVEQQRMPFAIFECKRVGVEEGMKKGPQTIEKAKQGAYVARTTSSLQKVWDDEGRMYGIIFKADGTFDLKPYEKLIDEVVNSNNKDLLRRFILTVGVVSNHGNWFSSQNTNKELKVLAQSYDWLLFLTDEGLSTFIETLLLNPIGKYEIVRTSFINSYQKDKTKNQFTKVQMNAECDRLLTLYFQQRKTKVEKWFNIISPNNKGLSILQDELWTLSRKNWSEILA